MAHGGYTEWFLHEIRVLDRGSVDKEVCNLAHNVACRYEFLGLDSCCEVFACLRACLKPSPYYYYFGA